MGTWATQFTNAEFNLAQDTMLHVAAENWRLGARAGLLFHQAARSFNLIFVDRVTSRPIVAIVALLAARQYIRMKSIHDHTALGHPIDDKPARLLADAMRTRDKDAKNKKEGEHAVGAD